MMYIVALHEHNGVKGKIEYTVIIFSVLGKIYVNDHASVPITTPNGNNWSAADFIIKDNFTAYKIDMQYSQLRINNITRR